MSGSQRGSSISAAAHMRSPNVASWRTPTQRGAAQNASRQSRCKFILITLHARYHVRDERHPVSKAISGANRERLVFQLVAPRAPPRARVSAAQPRSHPATEFLLAAGRSVKRVERTVMPPHLALGIHSPASTSASARSARLRRARRAAGAGCPERRVRRLRASSARPPRGCGGCARAEAHVQRHLRAARLSSRPAASRRAIGRARTPGPLAAPRRAGPPPRSAGVGAAGAACVASAAGSGPPRRAGGCRSAATMLPWSLRRRAERARQRRVKERIVACVSHLPALTGAGPRAEEGGVQLWALSRLRAASDSKKPAGAAAAGLQPQRLPAPDGIHAA